MKFDVELVELYEVDPDIDMVVGSGSNFCHHKMPLLDEEEPSNKGPGSPWVMERRGVISLSSQFQNIPGFDLLMNRGQIEELEQQVIV